MTEDEVCTMLVDYALRGYYFVYNQKRDKYPGWQDKLIRHSLSAELDYRTNEPLYAWANKDWDFDGEAHVIMDGNEIKSMVRRITLNEAIDYVRLTWPGLDPLVRLADYQV